MDKLTFEHFCDRPTWAVAAGYDFNIIDCLSSAATRFEIAKSISDVMRNIPDIELRDVWWKLPTYLLSILILVTWPLTFWVAGVITYLKCLRSRKKYLGSKNERVQINLRNWLDDFELNQRRKARR
ncbi:hypothetical protein AAY84_07605 [Serratia marcescens]|uniref:hypothetical protein n=1 Tax=Serratia marcescens TaxID=615 RepID=UPI00062C8065|nr:hypothetical protein [Serratia marcescens]KKZ19043.1 hypothetical protein AAY84_07605 [Serratia marcescens]